LSYTDEAQAVSMSWSTRVPPFLAVAALLLCAVQAQATVVVLHSIEEMSRRSEVVVQARVTATRVTKEKGRIITLTELEVVDAFKGAKTGDKLTVFQVGGTLDGFTSQVVGAHEYAVGEELVWFGVRLGDRVVSYGVGVGKFRIVLDGSLSRVVEDIGDVAVLNRDAATGATSMTSPSPRTADSLAAFKQQVRDALALGDLPRSRSLDPKKIDPNKKVAPAPRKMKPLKRYTDSLRVKPEAQR
jgi:hypothetical protein